MTTDRADCGILDYDCIAETQQMLPWGSQYRNIVSREGHAWVLASLDSDPQVAAAALAAEDAARQLGARGTLSLLAYSDGSVIADGIEGSAAAVIRIGDVDVSATIRLAAADRALSSGRSEWAGLLLVQAILRRVRANVTLRLGNLQVVNRFDDGEERFAHDWLRQNERDMASLAWEMAAARERRGFGSIKVLHQLGHPEKRKAAADYDEHERYNVKVDALTHAITPDMPLYISFRRTGRRQTQLWYEPTEHENVGHGTCHEVTGDVYRHSLVLRSAAQRSGGERSFYAPRRRAPPEGREGVSFSVWAHSDTTKSDHKRTHHTHKGKDARRSLDSGLPHSLRQSDRGRQRRERATRAVSKNKQGPSSRAAQAPPFFKGCGDRERCQFPFLWKDRIRRI